MSSVIYADVLVFLNIIITFLLLLTTSRITKTSAKAGRYALGCFLGGAFSLIILAPDMGVILSLLIKLIMSLAVIFAVYSPKTLRAVLRIWSCFFLVNFIFAGIMTFLGGLISSELIRVKNGTVYMNFSFLSLVLSSLICYGATCILNKISGRKSGGSREFDITVTKGGREIKGRAAVDTGNSLTDPFTGESVIITDKSFIMPVLPNNIKDYLNGGSEKCREIRLIPFSTVSAEGLLPCFRCDKIYITDGKSEYSLTKAEVAVSSTSLHGCSVLLSPEILADNERRKENAKAFK
ncbi:MAG: sigma-E processing peptidase SpoIIGA [Clostridiales bacterium]|nr:sigma-E processing peptidase SpoIIGA [Clostridiales bacterium]